MVVARRCERSSGISIYSHSHKRRSVTTGDAGGDRRPMFARSRVAFIAEPAPSNHCATGIYTTRHGREMQRKASGRQWRFEYWAVSCTL